jgi:hypothetical protein
MTDITIPPEALEKAARAMWRTDEPSQWELGMADIALRAGINAWPGMEIELVGMEEDYLILPMDTENTND